MRTFVYIYDYTVEGELFIFMGEEPLSEGNDYLLYEYCHHMPADVTEHVVELRVPGAEEAVQFKVYSVTIDESNLGLIPVLIAFCQRQAIRLDKGLELQEASHPVSIDADDIFNGMGDWEPKFSQN